MTFSIFLGFLLLGLVASAPTTNDDKLVVDKDFFPESMKVYEGQHDIVKIYVPLNKLNFEGDEDLRHDDSDGEVTLFFVTADIQGNEKFDQGLYIKKGDVVTKLLDHGRDVTAPLDDESQAAYFATKDGIYEYISKENKAEKYGTVDDDLIAIVMGNATDGIYVLSADKKVYKVTEDGTKKELVDQIKSAEQIALDFSGNLYYVDSDNKVFIVNSEGAKEITSLPENFSKITLIRPPFVFESGIPVVIDKEAYTLHANGTLEDEDIKIDTEITAYALDASIIHYYAREKKIYEYNILALLLGNVLEKLSEFMGNFEKEIQSIATRPRSEFLSTNRI